MHPPGDAIVPLDVCRAGRGNASFFLSEVMRESNPRMTSATSRVQSAGMASCKPALAAACVDPPTWTAWQRGMLLPKCRCDTVASLMRSSARF